MKILILSLSLVILSATAFARSHPDLDGGTVKFCKGEIGDLDEIVVRAIITPIRQSDGSVNLHVISDFAQCLAEASGNKSFHTLKSPSAFNFFGKMVFNNFQLVISSSVGDLVSKTNLALEDDQTIHISAETAKKIGPYLDVGFTAHQDFYVDGILADEQELFFGSYIITRF